MSIIEIIIGCIITLIGFFLKRTMDQLDKTTAKCYQNENALKILSNTFELKHESLGKQMEKLKIPLNEREEAILELMRKVNHLEHENQNLKEEIKRLKWSMTEHD